MIVDIFAALLITCLVGVGALEVERRSANCRDRSRSVWFVAMLCSLAVSLLPIYRACGRTFGNASAPSGRLWADPTGLLWLLGRVHVVPSVSTCWALMSITLLQVIAYDLIQPYLILRKLSLLERGFTRIHVSEKSGPLTFGFLKPKIVVPRYFLELDGQMQELILIHEREHIVKRDWLLRVFGFVVIVLVPWNPVLYWQLARLTQAIEHDCDARVLAKLGYRDRRGYVNCLLSVSERLPPSCNARLRLMRRIRAICTPEDLGELLGNLSASAAK